MEIVTIRHASEWNDRIAHLPAAHVLQTYEWSRVKAEFGWEPYYLIWRGDDGENIQAAALVLKRKITLGGFTLPASVMYAPRGPLLDWAHPQLSAQVLTDLQAFARRQNAIFIKIDPALPVGFGIPGEADVEDQPVGLRLQHALTERGWLLSNEQIQFKNTMVIDLRPDQETLLMQMKSKTRYNIRLAERRGVTVRTGGVPDIDLLYQLYAHTAVRDNFLIRNKTYYQTVWGQFFSAGLAEPLIAEVDGQPVGALVIFHFSGTAWYIHGMSLDDHREKMFSYLLQWQAILQAKARGCAAYDMWGAPDHFNESDAMWGVYRFKEGFGGQVVRTLGAYDYPLRPIRYRFYQQILPRILNLMRRHGRAETQQALQA